MKTSMVSGMAAALIALMGSAHSVQAQKVESFTAQVTHVLGHARYTKDHRKWEKLKPGMEITPGMVFQTGENSSVDIALAIDSGNAADNSLKLFPNSVLATGVAEGTSALEFELQVGQLAGKIGHLTRQSHFELKYPTGFIGVTEAAYQVRAAGNLDVKQGQVVAVNVSADGKTHTKVVHAGETLDPFSEDVTPLSIDAPLKKSTVTTNANGIAVGEAQPGTISAMTNSPESKIHGTGMGGSLRKF